MHGKFEA
ncbi:hypothetical protein AYI68_g6572, partial [Smittium mucronatum]